MADEVNKGHKVPKLTGSAVMDLLLKFKLMVDVMDTCTSLAASVSSTSRDRTFNYNFLCLIFYQ